MPTEDGFTPDHPLPLFLSGHADEHEERGSLLLLADSGDCGQRFRLNATMQSDRRRPPVPTQAAGVSLPA